LAGAKFKVVNELEQHFPYRPFEREWEFFKGPDGGKKRRSMGLTQIELLAPLFLGVAAFFTIVAVNWGLFAALWANQ
jgi:hypothetical protein